MRRGQLMRIYGKNNPAKCHSDLICVFFKRSQEEEEEEEEEEEQQQQQQQQQR